MYNAGPAISHGSTPAVVRTSGPSRYVITDYNTEEKKSFELPSASIITRIIACFDTNRYIHIDHIGDPTACNVSTR